MPRSAVPEAPQARPRISRRDAAVAAGYAALTVLLAGAGVTNNAALGDVLTWPLGVSVAVLLLGSVATAWRRSAPEVTLVVTGLASLADLLFGGQITGFILLFDAVFVPVLHGSRRLARATTAGAAAVTVLSLVVTAVFTQSPEYVLVIVLVTTLVLLTPLMWAWEVRHHRQARETAETLAEAEHELAATRSAHAVEQERRRIAHDLHDVIAGHLSAVTLHTNLAASLEDRQTRDRSLSTARESARAALRDLQSMIGVLATEEGGQLPVATLDWDSLTERLRGRDPDALVAIDPAVTDPARVEPSTQAALLRIAAEAVTNAIRHGAAPISLLVELSGDDSHAGDDGEGDDGGDEEVSLVLENHRAAESQPGTGVGRGALRHRAQAVGGTAHSGAADANRWRVEARLPTRPRAPAPSQEASA